LPDIDTHRHIGDTTGSPSREVIECPASRSTAAQGKIRLKIPF